MKVGFFTTTYLPISYGSVTSVRNFRKGLKELGHQVYIFTPRFADYQDRESNIYRCPSLMYGYKIKYPLAVPFHPAAKRHVKKLKLDVIHCHQPFSVGAQGLSIGRALKIPIVFTHHCRYEDYVHYIPPVLPRGPIKWYVKKQATKFANRSDYVIAPSGSIKKMIESRGVIKPIKVLPTGIEWERFQDGDREKVRNENKIEDNEILIMNSGRIDEEKNIRFLIRSLFHLLEKDKKIKIMFVGEGSLRNEIEKQAQNRRIVSQVMITGLLPQQQMQHYYAAGDIFVQASLTETQGMSLLEALATGLPAVAVRATGAVDQIEHNKTGLLVDNDEKVFSSAVQELLKNTVKSREIGEAAREYGRKCDYRQRAKTLVEVYNKIRDFYK